MAENFEYTRSWLSEEDFPLLSFTRTWEDPNDYPTIETDEAKVRADMQSLHDEVKDYLNTVLIPKVIEEDATVDAWRAAEAERTTNEEARQASEQARVEAEETRVAAEAARVEKVQQLEEQVQSAVAGATDKANQYALEAAYQAKIAQYGQVEGSSFSTYFSAPGTQTITVENPLETGRRYLLSVENMKYNAVASVEAVYTGSSFNVPRINSVSIAYAGVDKLEVDCVSSEILVVFRPVDDDVYGPPAELAQSSASAASSYAEAAISARGNAAVSEQNAASSASSASASAAAAAASAERAQQIVDGDFATRSDLDTHNTDKSAHGDIRNELSTVSQAAQSAASQASSAQETANEAKSAAKGKASADLSNVSDEDFAAKAEAAGVGGSGTGGAVESVNGFTGAVQLFTYGTEDMVAGVSELPTGTLYFVYE
jgi:hypothetical protein